MRICLIASCMALALASLSAHAAAPTLALTCYGQTLPVPANCQPTWHTPVATSAVQTQAGTWVLFGSPPTPQIIKWCSSPNVFPGNPAAACPAASVVLAAGCNASCGAAPPPAPPPPVLPAAANLSWTAPATFVDGTAITVPLTYNVYRGATAATLTKLTNVTGTVYTDPAGSAAATTYIYAVTALCAACTESADSGTVTVTIAATQHQPSPPTSLADH
jgi:hypothetical protein